MKKKKKNILWRTETHHHDYQERNRNIIFGDLDINIWEFWMAQEVMCRLLKTEYHHEVQVSFEHNLARVSICILKNKYKVTMCL